MRTCGKCAILCCLLPLLLTVVLCGCGTVLLSPLVREDIKLLSGHYKYPLKVAVITGNVKDYKFTPDKRRSSYFYIDGKRHYDHCFFYFVETYKDFFPRVFDQVDFVENYPLESHKYHLIIKLVPIHVNNVTKDSKKYAELKMEVDVVFCKVDAELLRLKFEGRGQSNYGTTKVKYPDRQLLIMWNYYGAARNVTRSIFQQLASELTQHPNKIDKYVNCLARLKQEEMKRNALPANEIEITPANHGSLDAKNVRLRINSRDLNYSSDTVNIGDLKPGTSGSPQWFDLHIPRAFAKSKLTVELSLDQSDFTGKTDTIEIPVVVIAPKLGYTAAVSGRHGGNTIEQGERAYLEVQVQNSGGLEARDVKLKLNIANSNVKIMDENERVIPHIAAGTFSETLKFDLLVQRKVHPGELPVRISLTQADFSDVDFEHKLMVKAEGAEMMEVASATGGKARRFTSSGSIGPVLAIARPQNGLRVYDESLDISGTVVDARGIDKIEVKINGRQKPVTIASASTMNKKEFFASLHLKNGENRIVVAAYNNSDIRSEEVRIVYKVTAIGSESHIPPLSLFCDVDKKALELPAVGQNVDYKKWAVVIGVEKYRRAPSVPYAQRDAQAVYEYFTRLFRIPAENCFALFDEQATLGEFLDLFEDRLPALVSKGDTVYCYFAGHGVPDVGDQTSYLLPYDGKPSNPKRTAYASADLYASLGRLKAKNVFVFLDACFSGSAGRSLDQKLLFEGARPGLMRIKDLIPVQKNMILFAAAESNQASNAYQEKQHGLFTYYLLKGLWADSAQNRSNVINVKYLADYVKKTSITYRESSDQTWFKFLR